MVKLRAKVLFLHILKADTVVIQHRLIHRQYSPIGLRHLYEGWDGGYCQTQIALAQLLSLFILFAIVDVRVDPVPLDDFPLLVAHRARAEEKPPILSVVTAHSRLRLS